MNNADEMFPCPCCGMLTFEEPLDGTYLICDVCFWEDDPVQLADPSYAGGANEDSLEQSRKNYLEFGACSKRCLESVRKPLPEEIPPS